jgi:hypothetical protein
MWNYASTCTRLHNVTLLAPRSTLRTGSQKVPGMVILNCNCRTYGNAYLIIFKAGLLRVHARTHAYKYLPHRSCHCLNNRRKSSFGIFRSSAVEFDLMTSMVAKVSPRGPFSEQGTAESHSERDLESAVVG